MKEHSVLAIVTLFRRPENTLRIVEALRKQTHPCKIVVVDNSPADYGDRRDYVRYGKARQGLDNLHDSGRIDDIWRWTKNSGPPCRFAPAFMRHDCQYVAFFDDDLLPRPKVIEHYLDTADQLQGRFATLGQVGRQFANDSGKWEYVRQNVKLQRDQPTPVDMTVRAHFTWASHMPYVFMFKWQLLATFGSGLSYWVDFLLLCCGAQRGCGYPSYLFPANDDTDNRIKTWGMNDAHTYGAHPDHVDRRSELIQCAATLGWQSKWAKITRKQEERTRLETGT